LWWINTTEKWKGVSKIYMQLQLYGNIDSANETLNLSQGGWKMSKMEEFMNLVEQFQNKQLKINNLCARNKLTQHR
jgi:hypothetical protein